VLALNATTDGPAAWATRVDVTNAGIAAASKIAPTNKIHLQVAVLLRTGTNLEFMALVIPSWHSGEKQFEVSGGGRILRLGPLRRNLPPWLNVHGVLIVCSSQSETQDADAPQRLRGCVGIGALTPASLPRHNEAAFRERQK